ncbi:MAG: DNA helicase RecQ, partial [Aureliella sp.]
MSSVADGLLGKAEETLRRVWGYESFRPLQQEAVTAALAGRDSLVVLPTGGGKSLCFQVPALCLDGLAVVVSPLISLMKDQVDSLQACGVSAAFINSTQSADEQREIAQQIRAGQLKLLYVAPERLLTDRMLEFLRGTPLSLFAIDEAHCISDWGHDFSPEYRGLRVLKDRFPQTPVHAYTATAAEQVRQDIVRQLGLSDAQIFVGSFDRPNLVYRMLPVDGRMQQILDVVARHRGESGVIYCISRKEVERVTGALNHLGIQAVSYHAGMDEGSRKRNQDAFIGDQADVVVATVAFGMGIDKPDVRYVVHAGMPKSIEHYQQESGRAGRDGLESECVLLYSAADLMTWKKMLANLESPAGDAAMRALNAMHNLCTSAVCRHRTLSAYFGQNLPGDNCGACDVCLGEIDQADDPVTLGQMILSCVLRLDQRFGADHTAKVLIGSSDQRVLQFGHDSLSTYGLLKEHSVSTVRGWIEQLVSQQFLMRDGEHQTLRVTPGGMRLLRRDATPSLSRPVERKAAAPKHTAADTQS